MCSALWSDSKGNQCHTPPTVTSSKIKGRWRRERGRSHFDRLCLAVLSSVFVSFTEILRQILKAAGWFEEVKLWSKFMQSLLRKGRSAEDRSSPRWTGKESAEWSSLSWIILSLQRYCLGFAGERRMSSERVPSRSEVMGWGPYQLSEYLRKVRPPHFHWFNDWHHFLSSLWWTDQKAKTV